MHGILYLYTYLNILQYNTSVIYILPMAHKFLFSLKQAKLYFVCVVCVMAYIARWDYITLQFRVFIICERNLH